MKNPETARRLREAMDNIGITANELSIKSGVSKPSISQYVNGRYVPSNIKAGMLAKVLKVNPVWLMGFDVPMIDDRDESYYINQEAKELAEFLKNNKRYRILFDASRKVKPEDIEKVTQMINILTGDD